MEEFEADDALAAAARLAAESDDVEQVIICTPDKDLSQCVKGQRVVQFDRRKRELRDENGVVARFGVGPASIPDYLALVGDFRRRFPWRSRMGREGFRRDPRTFMRIWSESQPVMRSGRCRSAAPRASRPRWTSIGTWRSCFRTLATLRTDVPVFGTVDDLRWRRPNGGIRACRRAARRAGPVGSGAKNPADGLLGKP